MYVNGRRKECRIETTRVWEDLNNLVSGMKEECVYACIHGKGYEHESWGHRDQGSSFEVEC